MSPVRSIERSWMTLLAISTASKVLSIRSLVESAWSAKTWSHGLEVTGPTYCAGWSPVAPIQQLHTTSGISIKPLHSSVA